MNIDENRCKNLIKKMLNSMEESLSALKDINDAAGLKLDTPKIERDIVEIHEYVEDECYEEEE